MEQETKTIITKALKEFLKEKNFSLNYDIVYTTNKKLINILINKKNKKILIYDVTIANKKT